MARITEAMSLSCIGDDDARDGTKPAEEPYRMPTNDSDIDPIVPPSESGWAGVLSRRVTGLVAAPAPVR
jgi:hypothetical protein